MKIAIIGYSGSGKSTLARALGERYGVPVLHLDKVHWLPGWAERPREESREIVEKFLDSSDAWVIDGNYGKLLYERRMSEADNIIFMSFNRFACLKRAIKRYRDYRGRSRFSITEGCPERIDRDFFFRLVWSGRTGARRKKFSEVIKKHRDKAVIIKNQKQLDRFWRERGLTKEDL